MWEEEKYSPCFSSVKDEGCGKRENVPLFYKGRMRDVGRGKVLPTFSHPGKDAGCGKGESIPHFYSSKEG